MLLILQLVVFGAVAYGNVYASRHLARLADDLNLNAE
jgi:hypothetical protein